MLVRGGGIAEAVSEFTTTDLPPRRPCAAVVGRDVSVTDQLAFGAVEAESRRSSAGR
jgi:hypothetical protein